jgi:hypothetical protein
MSEHANKFKEWQSQPRRQTAAAEEVSSVGLVKGPGACYARETQQASQQTKLPDMACMASHFVQLFSASTVHSTQPRQTVYIYTNAYPCFRLSRHMAISIQIPINSFNAQT